MQVPLQLTFRAVAHSEALASHLGRRAEKLEKLFHRIVSCHVVVRLTSGRAGKRNGYQVAIHLSLPGHVILVSRTSSLDAARAGDHAFDECARQLEDWVRRGRVRRHEERALRNPP